MLWPYKINPVLDDKSYVFLPNRFVKIFTKEKMKMCNKKSNNKYNLIYNKGSENFYNRKNAHFYFLMNLKKYILS